MRNSLKDLINKTILFQYHLPNTNIRAQRSKISTDNDSCYSSSCNEDLAEVIYNAVIEYAFDEYRITEADFQSLHRTALTRKLKFNDAAKVEQQLKYGFYGEVILYCMLYIFYHSPPAISRGHFYNPLENGETKGYDAYHLISNNGQLELWFGEVKFYAVFSAATTGSNGAITNLKKAISDEYLSTNLIAISERQSDLADLGAGLIPVLADIRSNPEIKIADLANKYQIKLVYPILILFNEKKAGYDDTIRKAIQHIEDEVEDLKYGISIDVSVFFIFVPVECAKDIKSKVIQWIRDSKQLMS